MATKPQAKTAIDNGMIAIKDDIDNRLPVGVNIKDGDIHFNPTTWNFQLDAGGVLATATSWRDTILANLTAAGRTYRVKNNLGRRESDQSGDSKFIRIDTDLASYIIVNIGS